MKQKSAYLSKIDTVLNYIRGNLDKELTIAEIAEVAYLSPFHFHRIYSAITNETVYDTILRLRMESAIIALSKSPEIPIIEIAFDVGFQNPSSFSRAFKRFFGFSPSDVRQRRESENSKISILKRKYGKELSIQDLYPCDVFNIKGEKKMNVEIKQLDNQPMIYLSSDYTHENSMATWMQLHKWFEENKGTAVDNWNCIGLYYNDPTVTPEDMCQSKLCLLTPETVELSKPFTTSSIPAGKYAIARYTIREEDKQMWTDKDFEAQEFHNFIQSFYKQWLIASGYEADEYPLLMAYNTEHDKVLRDKNGAPYFAVDSIDVMIKLK